MLQLSWPYTVRLAGHEYVLLVGCTGWADRRIGNLGKRLYLEIFFFESVLGFNHIDVVGGRGGGGRRGAGGGGKEGKTIWADIMAFYWRMIDAIVWSTEEGMPGLLTLSKNVSFCPRNVQGTTQSVCQGTSPATEHKDSHSHPLVTSSRNIYSVAH